MDLPHTYKPLTGSGHIHPENHKVLKPTADDTPVTVTLIVRRRPDGPKLPKAEEITAHGRIGHNRLSRAEFAASHGADPKELEEVAHFAVPKNQVAPSIYVTNVNPAPGPQPMDIVSADYLTVDDNSDAEGLQSSGIMNDTDDAFLFYAISKMTGRQPKWLSVRNASEPQIVVPAFAPGTSPTAIGNKLKGVAGRHLRHLPILHDTE